MKDVGEAMPGEQARDERLVEHRALDQARPARHVPGEPAAQIVEDHDVVAAADELARHVRSDEPGAAGDEDRHVYTPARPDRSRANWS